MPDLDERFRSLTRTHPPDLWPDIAHREPRGPDGASPGRRVAAGAVAFVVFVAAFAFAVWSFRGHERPSATGASQLQPIPKGNGLIYYRVGGVEAGSFVASVEPDGSGGHVVFAPDDPVRYFRMSWSPDGSRIAFVDFRAGHYGIFTANPDGTRVQQLTDGVNDSYPSWSPDGSKIVFSSTRDDCSNSDAAGCRTTGDLGPWQDVWIMSPDGSDQRRVTAESGQFFAWSPDGSAILVAGRDGLYLIRPDGSDEAPFPVPGVNQPLFPDWIA